MNLPYSYADLAGMIDHALLNPSLTDAELQAGCELAKAYEVASVCIMPFALARCAELLRGSAVRASTTIGFPHGAHTTAVKVAEACKAIADGAEELDMVVNISQVRSGNWAYVRADIADVLAVIRASDKKLKVIFENAYLDDQQRVRLCEICGTLGVDWVKTSTGFAPTGATNEDLTLMRQHSPPHVQVKAAGGIRDLDRLLEVRGLGATRCGASATAAILDAARVRLGLPRVLPEAPLPTSGY